jgi:hypothetical protein
MHAMACTKGNISYPFFHDSMKKETRRVETDMVGSYFISCEWLVRPGATTGETIVLTRQPTKRTVVRYIIRAV